MTLSRCRSAHGTTTTSPQVANRGASFKRRSRSALNSSTSSTCTSAPATTSAAAGRLLHGEDPRQPELIGPRLVLGDLNEWTHGLTTHLLRYTFQTFRPRHTGRFPAHSPACCPWSRSTTATTKRLSNASKTTSWHTHRPRRFRPSAPHRRVHRRHAVATNHPTDHAGTR